MITILDLMIVENFYDSLELPNAEMTVLEFKSTCYTRWATEEIYKRLYDYSMNNVDISPEDAISAFEADMEYYICRTEDDLDQCFIFEIAADTAEAIKEYSKYQENHD